MDSQTSEQIFGSERAYIEAKRVILAMFDGRRVLVDRITSPSDGCIIYLLKFEHHAADRRAEYLKAILTQPSTTRETEYQLTSRSRSEVLARATEVVRAVLSPMSWLA